MNLVPMDAMPYLILSAGLCFCLLLFVFIKAEMLRQSRSAKQARGQVERTVERLHAELEELRQQVGATAQPQTSPRPSLNLNRRTQVLRMSRRGDRPDQIASALGVPQNEVDLLLKLQLRSRKASA